MGFFDALGNVFGFGNSRNAYNYSPSAPQFISPEYIDNLNDLARVASSRTADTSLADALLKQQTDRALKDQYSLAASTKGQVNPALLQRQIMKNAAETGQKNAQSAAIVQAQAQREQQKQNDALALEYRKMALNAKLAQADANLKAQGYQTQLAQAATQGTTGAIGGLFSAGGTLGAAAISDENEKKEIKDGVKELHELLDSIDVKTYKYKDKENGEGKRVGPMAQDMEESELGDALVKETSKGKAIDMRGGFTAVLAATADLHQRLKEIEDKMNSKKKKG